MIWITDREYWFWLINIQGIGNKKIKKLLDKYIEPNQIYKAKYDELIKIDGISEKDTQRIIESRNYEFICRELEKLKEKEIELVLRFDNNYPKILNNIYDPPYGLYVRGILENDYGPSIAIVGARECSNYGKSIARFMGRELSKRGISIISGMAKGIDAYAHLGAIEAGAPTYAVLGCGVDICYPESNIDIFMNIIKKGAIISELPPSTIPRAGNFPLRNRIISGMADAILVVESQEKSGSLITVDIGLEQGKDIYAIPGRIDDKLSSGCNNLIKMGAKLVTNIDDILEDFCNKINKENNQKECEKFIKNKIVLESDEKIVYACLRLEPKHIDEIIRETGLKLNEIIRVLYKLEKKGLIEQTTNSYYFRHSDIW